MFSKKVMIATLTTAALVWPAAAPARVPDQVPSPPSWTAASAGEAYEAVRSAAATDGVQDLRSPDTRDQASGYAPVSPESGADVTSRPDVASSGFDPVSGALGAAAGISLAIVAVALAGGFAHVRRPRHHAAHS